MTLYDDAFFDSMTEGSLQSARVVVPILLNLVQPQSIIEIGCGRGAWLKVFQENGIAVIRGLDGPWVNHSNLLIDAANFHMVDFNQPFEIEGQYDLAVCLEVVEHVPDKAGRFLIRQLTRTAPLVLFSASIPGQEGLGHVNEQMPRYWESIFSEFGFRMLSPIRRHVLQDSRVEWWYRQNIILFASSDAIAKSPILQAEAENNGLELEWIYKEVFEAILVRYIYHTSLRGILAEFPRATLRAVKRLLTCLR
jgi:SAM-dependent methyltransferase